MENIKEKILKVLQTVNDEIKDEYVDLISSGKIDSFGIASIIAGLEEEFCIEFLPEDIVPENFSAISCICDIVEKRIGK